VTFDIDANGILSVGAADKATGKDQTIRIEGSGGLTSDEIDRMVSEAAANASDDKARRELIDKKNQLDSLIYQAEKTIAENAEKIDEAEQTALNAALADAKADLESGDAAKLDAARQRVEAEMHKIAEKLYQNEAAPGGPEASGDSSPGGASGVGDDDDVIDAEFTQENDDS
jgi:molecular chaperone DnaK